MVINGTQPPDDRIPIVELNDQIKCRLCNGYLIEATAVTECLHTFCRSCIVKYLDDDEKNDCPTCERIIHMSHPKHYLCQDPKMQDLVNKLVPGLLEKSRQQEINFYKREKLPLPDHLHVIPSPKRDDQQQEQPGADCNFHRDDEHLIVQLESSEPDVLPQIMDKFCTCSSNATILCVKKSLALRLSRLTGDHIHPENVELSCNNRVAGKDHTLKFVQLTNWRGRNEPMLLLYKLRID